MGKHNRRNRKWRLRERDGERCWWCGKPMKFDADDHPLAATVEHLRPRSKRGANTDANTVLAHRVCNNNRGNMTVHEYWARLLNRARARKDQRLIEWLLAKVSA